MYITPLSISVPTLVTGRDRHGQPVHPTVMVSELFSAIPTGFAERKLTHIAHHLHIFQIGFMGHATCRSESYGWMLTKVREWFQDWRSLNLQVSVENAEMHQVLTKQGANRKSGQERKFELDSLAFSTDQVSGRNGNAL